MQKLSPAVVQVRRFHFGRGHSQLHRLSAAVGDKRVHALWHPGRWHSHIGSPYGHDSFLLDVPALDRVVAGFLGEAR
ncbi:MAG: hypothetical protein EOO38_11780 [Cytophagaceae bacterium]|nr:MAG: hypothetical protein EOO38_11780 [Cytophagaceae bacterium]